MTLFQRLFKTMTNPWVALSYLAFIGLSILYFDKPIALHFHQLDFGQVKPKIELISYLGISSVYFVILTGLILIFRFGFKNKVWERRTCFLLLCLTVSTLICFALKMCLGRARPDLWFDQNLYGFYGFHTHKNFWSFPSGHTSTVMSLAFALSVLFPRMFYPAIFFGLVVVASRVILTHHFLGDVMMASYLALLEVGFLVYLIRRTKNHRYVSII